jgi:hypothetical protein
MSKDATITVRVPAATRKRIEDMAQHEGRSLSQQVERLIVQAMDASFGGARTRGRGAPRDLAGALEEGRVPTLADCRAVRALLSASMGGRTSRP